MSKTLIIGFSKPKSPWSIFGHLIRIYTGADYSHCYIKFKSSQLISQASKGIVNFTHEDVFLKNNLVIREFHIPVSDIQFEQIARYAIKTAGKPYSILQIFGIILADILSLDRNPLDMNKNTFVCSEYLGQILKLLGVKLDKHLSLVSPEDVYFKLEKLYGN
jgi:hypothetical protein